MKGVRGMREDLLGLFFFLMRRLPPGSTLLPSTTVFRSYRPAQVTLRFYNVSALEGFISSYENKEIDELYVKLTNSVDADERDGLLRAIGQIKFDNYAEVPVAWLPGQMIIDPSVVKTFTYPGNINAGFSHIADVVPAQ